MQAVIENIVALEWEAFQEVHNVGGRASCQNDYKTFVIMRKSQFLSWNKAMLDSYLHDLMTANEEGRNILSEKYARMMQYTAPAEYAQLEAALPTLSSEHIVLVDTICSIQLAWQHIFATTYPRLASRGRPVENTTASGMTSFEVYLRGELQTYSFATLTIYAAYIRELESQGANLTILSMGHMVALYGYASLEEAESAL